MVTFRVLLYNPLFLNPLCLNIWDTQRLCNTLLNDLEDPLMLADIPSSQISSEETHRHLLPFPNYRVSRDETLKQHYSVWLEKRSFSPVRGQRDRQTDRLRQREKKNNKTMFKIQI